MSLQKFIHLRRDEAQRGPGYEPERGSEDEVHAEDDGVDDDEPLNFRLHLHQFDPDDRDSDARGDSDDSEVGVSEVVGLGSLLSRARIRRLSGLIRKLSGS